MSKSSGSGVSRLLQASAEEKRQLRLIGSGEGIHWDLLDEDISVEGIVTCGWRDTRSNFFSGLKDLRRIRKLKTGRRQFSQYLIHHTGDPAAAR